MISNNIKQIFSLQIILFVIVILFSIFSYINITKHEFIQWDDDVLITKNVFVKNLNTHSISHNFEKNRFTFLTLTVSSIIYKIWGNNPAPFHWFSILFHLLNIILVFQIIKKFSKNTLTISLVILLFALHPMRVETVAWISEIKGLLFTFFSLISFLLYIKYLTNNYKIKFYILALLMAVFASLSKIQGLMIPFSLILFDIYYKRKLNSKSIIEKLLLIFIFISLFFLPYKYQLINVVIIISAIYFIQKQEISKKTFLNFAHKKYLKQLL